MKCSLIIIAVIVLLFAPPCAAQNAITAKGGVPARAAREGRLIDDYVKAEMQRQRIPGLALAVIKDGEIILAKGYGFANVELADTGQAGDCLSVGLCRQTVYGHRSNDAGRRR